MYIISHTRKGVCILLKSCMWIAVCHERKSKRACSHSYWWEVLQMWRVLITDVMFWRKTCELCGLLFSQSNRLKRHVQSYRVESLQVWLVWITVSTYCICVVTYALSYWRDTFQRCMLIDLSYNTNARYVLPYWAEILQMWLVWQMFCCEWNFEDACAYSYWGEAFQMWNMWIMVCSEWTFEESHAHSYWGETVQMWNMWIMFCT